MDPQPLKCERCGKGFSRVAGIKRHRTTCKNRKATSDPDLHEDGLHEKSKSDSSHNLPRKRARLETAQRDLKADDSKSDDINNGSRDHVRVQQFTVRVLKSLLQILPISNR